MKRRSEIPGSLPREYCTARFWAWVNDGPVKLSIQPGDRWTHCIGGPNEEGYSWTEESWEHLGDVVERVTYTQALDCDGRLDTEYTDECPIGPEDLFHHPYGRRFDPEEPGQILFPNWQGKAASQRDYEAEKAGY